MLRCFQLQCSPFFCCSIFYFILFVHILIRTRVSPPSVSVWLSFHSYLSRVILHLTWSHGLVTPFIIFYLAKRTRSRISTPQCFVHHWGVSLVLLTLCYSLLIRSSITLTLFLQVLLLNIVFCSPLRLSLLLYFFSPPPFPVHLCTC